MDDGDRAMTQVRRARPGWYRGLKLQKPVARPVTPLPRLRAAVTEAVRKNFGAGSGPASEQE